MGIYNTGFQLERKDLGNRKAFYGKYRAIVTNNRDTGRMGRIKVKCPKVLGDSESDWCTPCFPYAGQDRGVFFMPKVGETVWVEFEGGNPDLPIWVGSWWGDGEIPSEIASGYSNKEEDLHHIIKTPYCRIHLDDKDRNVVIEADGTTVTINDSGVVSIDGNLSVTGSITANGTVHGSNV